jgi:hypothetical protein
MMINLVFKNIFYPVLLTPSKYQTKTWRQEQTWYQNGKKNECELYQKNFIKLITGNELIDTKYRLNLRTLEMKKVKNPLLLNDGFDWSENFDGFQMNGSDCFLYNLKFVCDAGGAQTRTLRETYHFIEAQFKFSKLPDCNLFFINILEGDSVFQNINKFQYLQSNYADVNNIFIGDMEQFYKYWSNKFPIIV